MRVSSRLSAVLVMLVAATGGVGLFAAEEIRDSLFRETEQIFEAAKEVRAQILAPRNYSEAVSLFRRAEQKFEKGRNLESIRSDLSKAADYFGDSIEIAKAARLKLATLIKARGDARKAKAHEHATEIWQKAESKFVDTTRELEHGNAKTAEKVAVTAEALYRDAELSAIKTHYLRETRELLAQADKQNIARYAPKTLQKSRDLLLQAETALTENRYDTDAPRNLAQEANYEARHAIYLADAVKGARETGTESLILEWESPVKEIAAAADLVPHLDKGYQPPADQIVSFIEELQAEARGLRQAVTERDERLQVMSEEVSELERMLGGVSEERVALAKKIAAQERVRQQFEWVERMFTREEAQVLRESNGITVRLVGLSFAVGKSNVEQRSYGLMRKVQGAMQVFPGSKVLIEGHTDSHGADELNMRLSQQRADAVREYLWANMGADSHDIESVGYGETRPVANNETASGRAKNRRIDVVIQPPA